MPAADESDIAALPTRSNIIPSPHAHCGSSPGYKRRQSLGRGWHLDICCLWQQRSLECGEIALGESVPIPAASLPRHLRRVWHDDVSGQYLLLRLPIFYVPARKWTLFRWCLSCNIYGASCFNCEMLYCSRHHEGSMRPLPLSITNLAKGTDPRASRLEHFPHRAPHRRKRGVRRIQASVVLAHGRYHQREAKIVAPRFLVRRSGRFFLF